MFKNDTKVKLKDGRVGKIIRKKRGPRSKPVAWQYEIEFEDGKRQWVGRYEVKDDSKSDFSF